MPVDLDGRQLRYFTTLAEELNFTRAARRLHVAQQTLSDSIQQLERTVGVRLLDRSTRSVSLTPAGAVFRSHALALLKDADLAIEAARSVERSAEHRLVVGSPDWPDGIDLFREGITLLGSTAPTVTIDVAPTAWVRHLAAVDTGVLDVGVTFAANSAGLPGWAAVRSLGRERANRFLIAGDHPLAARERVFCEDLRDVTLLLIRRSDHAQLHDHLLGALVDRGLDPIVDADYGESYATAVAHALLHRSAIWVVPSMAREMPAGLMSIDVDDLAVEVELMAFWRRDRERDDIARFVDALSVAAAGRTALD